jgi:hypothetical protein
MNGALRVTGNRPCGVRISPRREALDGDDEQEGEAENAQLLRAVAVRLAL